MEKKPLRIGELAYMAKSPAHCRYAMDTEFAPTASMRLGSLAHAFALGKATPCIYPGEARRGKEWLAFKAEHEGEEIYKESELVEARCMARSLMNHDEASRLLLGRREETILWKFNGRECRGTPDVFNPKESTLVDLKTTVDASPQRFPWQALKLAYHAKTMWYRDGLEAAGIANVDRVFLVAVENRPPYAVAVYQLSYGAMEFGKKLYRSWLEQFLVHEASNHWPAYPPGIIEAPDDDFTLQIEGEEVEVA